MKGILLNNDSDLKIDVKLDASGKIISGSCIGETTYQNQKILILANKGDLKMNPTRGVGAIRFIEENNQNDLAREIRTEFIADGMTVEKIKIDNDLNIDVEAYYSQL